MAPLQRAGRFAYSHARLVMTIVLVLSILAAVGASRLRVDTNHINFFAERHPLARSAALIDRELSGIYSFNILLEGPPGTSMSTILPAITGNWGVPFVLVEATRS